MDRKLILFDIDGTLVDEEKKLPFSTKKAINDLKEKGHIIGIATGRAPFLFEHIREALDIHTYISTNGQYVVFEDKVVYINPLPQESIKKLIEFSQSHQHPLGFMDPNALKVNAGDSIHVLESIKSLKFDYPEIDSNYWKNRDIIQILLFNDGNKEEWYRNEFEDLDFIRWHEYSNDVLPKGGSKANGIKQLIKRLDIHLNDVYAFGDGLNDVEMLKYVPNSIAMGNAVDEAKAVAKTITTSVDNDGILNGLKMVGLL